MQARIVIVIVTEHMSLQAEHDANTHTADQQIEAIEPAVHIVRFLVEKNWSKPVRWPNVVPATFSPEAGPIVPGWFVARENAAAALALAPRVHTIVAAWAVTANGIHNEDSVGTCGPIWNRCCKNDGRIARDSAKNGDDKPRSEDRASGDVSDSSPRRGGPELH